ncbi:transposase [Chryseobacterium arthrosphaerae]|uniref:transposase n=1 Tax=Chryseobacterium arthrosphaerae TaxID=651561 RepID=UPI000F51046B|nr:transposase [Chryseobacterium arthrosphaerae]AYZ12774.1 transposase [Chryseobacterium arthrosphaerae]
MSNHTFKKIHIGSLVKQRVMELGKEMEMSRICNFLDCKESDVLEMYESESLDSKILLRWCKLLEYDFFRIYSQYLILYSPKSSNNIHYNKKVTNLPVFRKNIYTREIIDFIIELIQSGKKDRKQIIEEYRIPKTTLYKWLDKYKHNDT